MDWRKTTSNQIRQTQQKACTYGKVKQLRPKIDVNVKFALSKKQYSCECETVNFYTITSTEYWTIKAANNNINHSDCSIYNILYIGGQSNIFGRIFSGCARSHAEKIKNYNILNINDLMRIK